MTDAEQNPKQKQEYKMDFSGFILSLNASALIHLGDIPDPHTKQRNIDIAAAKHTIDILELISDKTQGNLTGDEKKLIDDVVYNLRLKYVKATK